MELTDIEMKLLGKLRKREATTHRFRYFELAMGIVNVVFAFVLMGAIQKILDWGPQQMAAEAMIWSIGYPLALTILVSGGLEIGMTLRDWNGNAERVLLIKLVEERTGKI